MGKALAKSGSNSFNVGSVGPCHEGLGLIALHGSLARNPCCGCFNVVHSVFTHCVDFVDDQRKRNGALVDRVCLVTCLEQGILFAQIQLSDNVKEMSDYVKTDKRTGANLGTHDLNIKTGIWSCPVALCPIGFSYENGLEVCLS